MHVELCLVPCQFIVIDHFEFFYPCHYKKMVRTYYRKTQRGSYGQQNLTEALKAIADGMPLNTVSETFKIPAKTLRRHRDTKVQNPGSLVLGRYRSDFSKDQELDLVELITKMEQSLFGLSTLDVRKLAYEFATKLGIKHRFNTEARMAGRDWLYGFLTRHPRLSIRKPQSFSISRLVGFNRPQVSAFFTIYMNLLNCHNFTPDKIWNMDETGISTVQKPVKIIGSKGTRQVGRVTSAERGQTVTVLCAMNAAGTYIPPIFIFPRKRMVDSLMNGCVPASKGLCTPSGWTDSECFINWLKHFAAFVKPNPNDKHLILLDGHHSHKTLEAINFARENGIELLTFPPHCTHKLQPLDRTFFKSLKSAYNASSDSWMSCHKGRRITSYEVVSIFSKAYVKVATIEKAMSGFCCTGLWPVDSDVFTDRDFAPSSLTDEPAPSSLTDEPAPSSLTDEPPCELIGNQDCQPNEQSDCQPDEPLCELLFSNENRPPDAASNCAPTQLTSYSDKCSEGPSASTSKTMLDEIIGPVRAATPRVRKRAAEKATLLTASPFKKRLEEKKISVRVSSKVGGAASQTTKKGKGKAAKQTVPAVTPCSSCFENYYDDNSGQTWTQCQNCQLWYHNSCQGLEENFVGSFFCIVCDDE
ncbi:flocculation protein FLO11 [Biomphalaria glabrata]|nr:jerky protein homolog-like [Biomphalaria glabrata]